MSRTSRPDIIELDGSRYVDLSMAQDASLNDVARALAAVVRDGITCNELTVTDGMVRLDNEKAEE